jgi:hypothetical protein
MSRPDVWCQTARVNVDGSITLERIADGPALVATTSGSSSSTTTTTRRTTISQYDENGPPTTSFDLTESVGWMEYLEHTEHREADEGGAGAYDTMRCDIVLSNHDSSHNNKINKKMERTKNNVLVWGQAFHLDRLQNSYLSLQDAKQQSQFRTPLSEETTVRQSLKEAIQQSNDIIDKLLDEAMTSVPLVDTARLADNELYFLLFRVTLLWSSTSTGNTGATTGSIITKSLDQNENDDSRNSPAIIVRGHATSTCHPMKVYQPHDPIVVSVAVHSDTNIRKAEKGVVKDATAFLEDDALPTRFKNNPHIKVASWCRLRKQMEQPAYKPPEASEVLMVRPRLDDTTTNKVQWEVLEGLSSNFFVIYKDGSLRTATQGVLNGYVRHLVLGSATTVGLTLDARPIYLHESDQWQECFITSSSRLIWPIAQVLLPQEENKPDASSKEIAFVQHWNYEDGGDQSTSPKWHDLWHAILKAGGYGPA